MSITYNGTEVQGVTYNGSDVNEITYNGTTVWSAAPRLEPVLKNNSIEAIQYAADHDLAASLWSIGDYFETTLNGTFDGKTYNNTVVRCVLIGINHNASKEGNHRLHFQIGQNANGVNIGLDYGKMNTSRTNSGGWNSSYMKSTVLPSIKALLPSDLQNAIKSVTKYTDNVGDGSAAASCVTATTEYGLWLLSEFEVFGAVPYSNLAEETNQVQYAYYANGNSKMRYKLSDPSSGDYWWLRSPSVSNNEKFCFIFPGGSKGTYFANDDNMVAPGFCL